MTDIQAKRAAVKALYPNEYWAYKVDNMHDDQVVAIYLQYQGKPKEKDESHKSDSQLHLF